MKKILIAISQSFPYGAAYAARTRALSKLFQEAGYYVDILCDFPSEGAETEEYGNIFAVAPKQYSGIKALAYLPIIYKRKLDLLLSNNKYDLIVSRSMFDRFDKVLTVARKHRVPIILESCEWYDVRGFRHGKKDIRYYQFQHCFNKSYNKVDGVIAISRLLEKHYKELGIPVVRIPGIHDVEKLPYRLEPRNDKFLELIFGGNVFGGKEQFSELLCAMSQINANTKILRLHMYGSSEAEVVDSLNEEGRKAYEKLRNQLIFHGQIAQSEMADACMEADFGLFFRPDRRSSHAGFPTKLGEYLSAGTPVITNDTGDISLIIENGNNGFILKKPTTESIKRILEKSILISPLECCRIRTCARNTAFEKLHYKEYVSEMIDFFDVINVKANGIKKTD